SSSMTIALASGERFELKDGARARLGESGLTGISGPIQRLAPLPPLTRVFGIRSDEHPGRRAGAVRVRGSFVEGFSPGRDVKSRAGGATLIFRPVEGAALYRVEVGDPSGRTVFRADTASPPVEIAPGVLRPGVTYSWSVRTLDRAGAAA